MAKQKETKYRALFIHGDTAVSVEELEKQMKKMRDWTLWNVERIVEPGYSGFLLKLVFVK